MAQVSPCDCLSTALGYSVDVFWLESFPSEQGRRARNRRGLNDAATALPDERQFMTIMCLVEVPRTLHYDSKSPTLASSRFF